MSVLFGTLLCCFCRVVVVGGSSGGVQMSTCVGGFPHADVLCNCMSVFLVSAGVFVVAWAVVQVCSTQGWAVLITFLPLGSMFKKQHHRCER